MNQDPVHRLSRVRMAIGVVLFVLVPAAGLIGVRKIRPAAAERGAAPVALASSAQLPSPPVASRIFSSGDPQQPGRIEVFSAPSLSPESSAQQHRHALEGAGFAVFAPSAPTAGAPERLTYLAQRWDLSVVAVAVPNETGGTTTTVMTTRSDAPSRAIEAGESP